MNIQVFFLVIVFFTLIISFGYIFSRRILNENKLIYLIPLSVCFGTSFFAILLHLLSLVLGIKTSTYLTFLILIILSFFIFLKLKPTTTIEYGLQKNQFFYVCFFSLFISLLLLWYLIKFNSFDSLAHLIGPLVKQKTYPPFCHYSPSALFIYHYGVILLGSALIIFSNIEVWYSLISIQVIFVFITPIVIFAFLFSITKSFTQSIFGSIIGIFCANLMSLTLFTLFGRDNLFSFFQNSYRVLAVMNESGFAVSVSKAFITPNMAAAIPLSILLFSLCTSTKIQEKKYWFVILIISSFLYFTYESFWFPVVLAVFLFHFVQILQSKAKINQLKISISLILLIAASTILVGGILLNTNFSKLSYFNLKSYIISWEGLSWFLYPAGSKWYIDHEIISHTDGLKFYKIPFFSKNFFLEMGMPLILLPIVLFWLAKKKNTTLLFFLLSGIVSLVIPFLINYIPRDVETTRFFTYSRLIFSILLGLFFGRLLEIKLTWFSSFIVRAILSVFIVTLTIPGVVWLIPLKYGERDYRTNQISNTDKKALKWLSQNMRAGDRGLGPFNNATLFELINLAGVYGIGILPVASFQETTRLTALTTLNPCLLKELKVRWIYLDEKLLSIIPQEIFNKLKDEKILQLRYKDKNSTREIYEFKSKNTSRYCNNTNYIWALGRMYNGKFVPAIDASSKSRITFSDKEQALKTLQILKKHLDFKEAYWYRVEAIKIEIKEE